MSSERWGVSTEEQWRDLIHNLRGYYPELDYMDDMRLLETCEDRLSQLSRVPSSELTPLEKAKLRLLPVAREFLV